MVEGNEVCDTGCLALIDSGTTQMVIPRAEAYPILVGSEDSNEAPVCKGPATLHIGAAPYHIKESQWCGRIIPMNDRVHMQLKSLTSDPQYKSYNWIVLGEAFLHAFYTVFDNTDIQAPRIGLAPVCRQSKALCLGKESQCSGDPDFQKSCPITCGLCGAKDDGLSSVMLDP